LLNHRDYTTNLFRIRQAFLDEAGVEIFCQKIRVG